MFFSTRFCPTQLRTMGEPVQRVRRKEGRTRMGGKPDKRGASGASKAKDKPKDAKVNKIIFFFHEVDYI